MIVVVVAALVFLGGVISPPGLIDDVDAVRGQTARNRRGSGDWVRAGLDGVAYLEKSPLIYWMIAASFAVSGVHDWAARLPLAVAAVLLCWLTYCIGRWAFSQRAGIYAGVALSTSVGLWLFTRAQIPDAMLTATMALALWSVLRALDEEEPRPGWRSAVFWASLALRLLGCFHGACSSWASHGWTIVRWTVPVGRDSCCSALPAFCSCSSASRRRKSITQCPATRRSLC